MLAQSMIVFATAVALIAGLSADASALLPLRVREKEQRQSLMNRARGPQAQKRSCNQKRLFPLILAAACLVGSTPGFARGGVVHAFGRGGRCCQKRGGIVRVRR